MKRSTIVLGAIALFVAAGMSPSKETLKVKMIRWEAKADPVYIEPDDDFVKDPSVLQAEGRYYMFYAGGPRQPVNRVFTGLATSKDLVHWTEHPQVVEHGAKANDPFVFEDGGRFYLFYTTYDEREPIFYRTSTDLLTWSGPVRTGADGEGTSVWKADGGGYYLIACTGYSGRGEYYKLFTSETLTGFQDLGKIDMVVPPFASGAFGHGDVIRRGGEEWFYFQGSRDGGKTFRIGLATHSAGLPLRDGTPNVKSP